FARRGDAILPFETPGRAPAQAQPQGAQGAGGTPRPDRGVGGRTRRAARRDGRPGLLSPGRRRDRRGEGPARGDRGGAGRRLRTMGRAGGPRRLIGTPAYATVHTGPERPVHGPASTCRTRGSDAPDSRTLSIMRPMPIGARVALVDRHARCVWAEAAI